MKRSGLWLCAVSTLALAACHRPTQPAATKPVAAANAAPPPAPAVLKIDSSASAPVAVVESSGAAAGPGAAASGARTGRHSRHDRVHHGRLAHRRAPPGGHSVIARTDAPGSVVHGAKRSSAAYKACISSAHGFTVALGDCYSAELARQGARLNRLYRAALVARSGREDARLQQSQSDWTRRRNAECRTDSAAATDIQSEGACRIDMTASRADELEQLVSHRRRGRS